MYSLRLRDRQRSDRAPGHCSTPGWQCRFSGAGRSSPSTTSPPSGVIRPDGELRRNTWYHDGVHRWEFEHSSMDANYPIVLFETTVSGAQMVSGTVDVFPKTTRLTTVQPCPGALFHARLAKRQASLLILRIPKMHKYVETAISLR